VSSSVASRSAPDLPSGRARRGLHGAGTAPADRVRPRDSGPP